MSENIFGIDWKKFAPHPIFNDWLPFAATIIGLVSSIVALAVGIMNYEKMKSS